jgi:hypothetical protein
MKVLMHISIETTEACVKKMEANQEKIDPKMEACQKGMEVETIGAPADQRLAVVCRNPRKRRTTESFV